MKDTIEKEINAHIIVAEQMHGLSDDIAKISSLCISSIRSGGKILIFGNGGSAADAQHIAAELVGRYKSDRKGLPAVALTTDTSALTSIANDFGYDQIFQRQIEALANPEDVVIGISTSGNSLNVISALKLSKKIGCKTIGLTGSDGGDMNKICDVNIVVPASDTPRIQEMHILIGHTFCQLIEQNLT